MKYPLVILFFLASNLAVANTIPLPSSQVQKTILRETRKRSPKTKTDVRKPKPKIKQANQQPSVKPKDESIKDMTRRKTPLPFKKRAIRNEPPVSPIRKHSIGLGLGQTFLMGQFSERGDDGITPDFYYSYSVSHSFDLMGNFHYSTHQEKNSQVTVAGLSLAVKARLFHFDSFSPFAFGGLGFYRPTETRQVGRRNLTSASKFVFGTNFGVGGDLQLSDRFSFGTLLHYHDPFDVEQNDGTPPVEGSYYKLLVTLMYSF